MLCLTLDRLYFVFKFLGWNLIFRIWKLECVVLIETDGLYFVFKFLIYFSFISDCVWILNLFVFNFGMVSCFVDIWHTVWILKNFEVVKTMLGWAKKVFKWNPKEKKKKKKVLTELNQIDLKWFDPKLEIEKFQILFGSTRLKTNIFCSAYDWFWTITPLLDVHPRQIKQIRAQLSNV